MTIKDNHSYHSGYHPPPLLHQPVTPLLTALCSSVSLVLRPPLKVICILISSTFQVIANESHRHRQEAAAHAQKLCIANEPDAV